MFYDYFTDLNHELASLFLKNPFIDAALIERKDKALKYWNFFSQKKVQKDISIVGHRTLVAADSESKTDSSEDTDSDSDLDKEDILKGDKPSLLGKEYEDNQDWKELLRPFDPETKKQIKEDIQLYIL